MTEQQFSAIQSFLSRSHPDVKYQGAAKAKPLRLWDLNYMCCWHSFELTSGSEYTYCWVFDKSSNDLHPITVGMEITRLEEDTPEVDLPMDHYRVTRVSNLEGFTLVYLTFVPLYGRNGTEDYVDDNGNLNCTDCVGCRNCMNCVGCKNCTGCNSCVRCEDCYDCINCFESVVCSECRNCRYCERCVSCERCHSCTDSIDCVFCMDRCGCKAQQSTRHLADAV